MRIAGLLILLAGAMCAQDPPPAAPQYGAFGFPDPSGTRLLAASTLPQPARFHTALCDGGRRYPVRFERAQPERPGHNGRQTPANFDRLPGNVFTVLQGKIEADAACFLASGHLLASAPLLPAAPPAASSGCDPEVRRRLASARARQVVNCWPIAHLPAGKSLVLVEFVRQDKDALASVVLIDRRRMIFADYPAVYRGEGTDLWRVDDPGALSPERFHVVFLLQRGTAYTLGIEWSAGEGPSLTVFVSNGANRFTPVIKDYWYREPV